MKILIVHNDYAKPSGEEAVVDRMIELFTALGHKTQVFRRSTAGLRESMYGKVRGFISGIYSRSGVLEMRRIMNDFKPDIVNVHNLYPFISPAALRECKKAGAQVVMTVHNYRLICPTGLFMRNNAPCEQCLKAGNEWGCIRNNCEHSYLKSIGYAARNAVARMRRDYLDCVDRFACITDFQRRKLIEAGYDAAKIFVIPNSVDCEDIIDERLYYNGEYVAYSGRISKEKGLDIIIETARKNPDIPFKLAGAVREEELVKNLPTNVELMGFLSGDALTDFYRGARLFVMASRWYEGFPVTILEASRYGKPTLGPDHGGFTEILRDAGSLFVPGNQFSFEQRLRDLWYNIEACAKMGEKARKKLENEYSTGNIACKWSLLLRSMERDRLNPLPRP